ncbi:MAG: polymerase, sigma-24 subunit, subfamily [Verrucomicrobiaceae bacterium]|nr:polymerase, sigma-24 subunit, subfamily [Verrucomicrobiaceae bacterium]
MPDTRELERLYDTHARELFRYFASFVRCEADAEDLLMELFARIVNLALPTDAQKEKAFLFRSAHNLAIDRLRSQTSRRKTLRAASAETDREFESGVDQDAGLFSARLFEAMALLPADQRSIVQLKLWDDLTFEQIAGVQSIPANTAASRYRYGIEKLRTLLRPLYEEIQP